MVEVMFALSVVNITMFCLAIIGSINTLRYVKLAHKVPLLKVLLTAFLSFTIVMSGWFVGLQSSWLLQDYNNLIGNAPAFHWLIYDYAKAVHTLAAVAAIYVYLRWSSCGQACNSKYRRRRRTDP